jgi:hypothetical protein
MAGEIILYVTEDGETQVALREIGGNVWLTQARLAKLFQVTPPRPSRGTSVPYTSTANSTNRQLVTITYKFEPRAPARSSGGFPTTACQ